MNRLAARTLLGVGVAAVCGALVLLFEYAILPRFLPVPRDAWLMGFVARPAPDLGAEPNALGLIGTLPSERDPRALRVLTLGGSVLFNRGMTARLETALAARAERPVSVLGAALRSHTSWASVHKYRFLRGYGFDVVVIAHGINDLYANHVAPADFRPDYSHVDPWYRRGPLLDRSIIARVLYNRFVWSRPEVVSDGSGQRAADVLRHNLEWLVREARRDGARPVLLTFAWWIPPDYTYARFAAGELSYENPERYDYCPVELWGPVSHVREGLVRHNVVIHAVARELDVDLIDMERLMAGDPRRFGDVCHPSARGAPIFADHLADWFAQQGLLREPEG